MPPTQISLTGLLLAAVLTIFVWQPTAIGNTATTVVDWAYATFGPETTCGQQ